MAARSRRSGTRRAPRRKTYWSQEIFDETLSTAGGGIVNDISHVSISLGNNAGGTCLRMVGNLNYFHSAASNEKFNLGIGVSVLTKDALTIGSVPDPLSDLEHDWYYWHAWEGNLGFADGQHSVDFDIRSSRRLREGFRLGWITQNFTQELVGLLRVRLRTLWILE